jgi:hypothetical protein
MADLAADRGCLDEGEAVLDQVAGLVSMRRAGVRPARPVPPLVPAPTDSRAVCPRAASLRLRGLLDEWPDLVDEWLGHVAAQGYRLAPNDVVTLLARTRGDHHRRATIMSLSGPLAGWLIELFPDQFTERSRGGAKRAPDDDQPGATGLPPDLAALVQLGGPQLAKTLAEGLVSGRFEPRHRPLLLRLLGAVPFAALEPVSIALARAGSNAATMGLALTLSDFAATRFQMIQELLP